MNKELSGNMTQAASGLNHPNILTIHEFGVENDQHFIVIEYVRGVSLREKLGRGGLTLGETLDIASQIASAALLQKAIILVQARRFDDALKTYRDAQAVDPAKEVPPFALGYAHAGKGLHHEAVGYHKTSVE